MATWATFAPCLLWIFLGAHFVELLRGNRWLNAGLSAVTAAVVGVILNLALTFGFAALFDAVRRVEWGSVSFPLPELTSLDLFGCILATVGFVALWQYRLNVLWLVAGSDLAGLIYRTLV